MSADTPFPLKSWVRFIQPHEIYVANLIIPVGTIAQVTEDDQNGLWVRPIKRFYELDEWLNQVQLWDWRIENNNPDDDHPGTYLVLVDCPF